MRVLRYLSVVVLLLSIPIGAHAQPVSASTSPLKATRSTSLRAALNGPPSATSEAGTQTIALGNATVPLTGPWKFHIGDNMAWAQPNYDDSAWGTMDLTPPPGSIDPGIGTSGWVPGWTARGYKGYHGYAWYRLRVNIENNRTALSLKMPDSFDDVYQVYVNGQRIGEFGKFTAHGPIAYFNLPRVFPLPPNFHSGPTTIAIRMWMSAYAQQMSLGVGGLHGPPLLGHASAIAGLLNLDWYAIDRSQYFRFLEIAILLLALAVAFALFWLDRTEPAYLWLGLLCADWLAWSLLTVLGTYTTWITENAWSFLVAIVTPPLLGLVALFWAYWFRIRRMRLVHWAVWTLVAIAAASTLMFNTPLYGSVVPVHAVVWGYPFFLIVEILVSALYAWILYRGIRKNPYEGWLAAPAIVLFILATFSAQLHINRNFFPFGMVVAVGDLVLVLSLIIITVLLLRRFLHGQRQRERWRSELEQARHIQSLLVPVKTPPTPGFAVESVYQPASEVGGDFFHLRLGEDGSLLVVVGDVSGKGLKAAMTVSTIVGALRNEKSRHPAEILANLNGVLHGQIKGFATCCATLIAADGAMTIANAGHIPPYRNGTEMGIPGDVPLGILPDVKYEEHRFELALGDRLTFVSDGIVEAMNAKRELFGFERTRQISHQPAAVIAETARQFGQEDDITVIGVQLAGAAAAV